MDFITLLQLLLPATLGGIGIALVAGPLGSFMVWRRMAYFGDTLAHSALFGIALGGLWQIDSNWLVILTACFIALTLALMQRNPILADDTLLGIIAHAVLSIGLVLYTMNPGPGRSLKNILFGDLVTIQWSDVIRIYCMAISILAILIAFWRPFINTLVDEDIATVEGLSVNKLRLLLMLLIALFIAISMQMVGVLLITALLITPAAAARYWAKTPEHMAVLGSFFAVISILLGLIAAAIYDSPVGPSVVVASTCIFFLTFLIRSSK